MLTGVDEVLLVLLTQDWRDRRRLDELRAVANYREDPHPASSVPIRACTVSAARAVTGPEAAKERSSTATTG